MRATSIAISLVLLVAACASDGDETTATTTTVASGPRAVVAGWIDAVIASDVEALGEIVEPAGLVVLAAIENGYSEDEIAELLDEGVPDAFTREYWSSFRAGFSDFAGIPLQSIEVGGQEQFMLGEVPYASVVIASGDGVTAVMATRRGEVWRLDLIGSFGPAFAAQLRRMLVNLPDTDAADRIRDAYRSDVVPGLLAALRRAPGNQVLGAELERMALLLER
jgi:hypothetical protein